jgi:hypothetical protein
MQKLIKIVLSGLLFYACQASVSTKKITSEGIAIPFIKTTPNECYYLDEFMPTPNSLVTGRSGSMKLRYYTYNSASYKDWTNKKIVMSFYSKDDICWSMFNEHLLID